MPGSKAQKQLALDTNLVLDLAHGADFAHDFREAFQVAGYALRLPPTAARELHENCVNGKTAQKRDLARLALLRLRSWDIQPLDLAGFQQAVAERFAVRLLEARLLPDSEFNDGLILAETSVAGIPLLITSDKHLLDIDEDALLLAFNEADLFLVRPAHPKGLLRALR